MGLEKGGPNQAAGATLRVENLTKRFAKTVAVDRLNLTLQGGEVLGLLGPNGAGKTTTFLCLCGLLRPDGGAIFFNDVRLGTERGRTIALIPETPDVYPMLTVWEHLAFVARSVELEPGWEERAEELLERLELTNARDALGQSLSKGMRQKTLIAAPVLAIAGKCDHTVPPEQTTSELGCQIIGGLSAGVVVIEESSKPVHLLTGHTVIALGGLEYCMKVLHDP